MLFCPFCPKTFSRKDNLSRHKLLHTETKTFFCTSCPKAFFGRHDLTTHFKVHSGERGFPCRVCSKFFLARTLSLCTFELTVGWSHLSVTTVVKGSHKTPLLQNNCEGILTRRFLSVRFASGYGEFIKMISSPRSLYKVQFYSYLHRKFSFNASSLKI